MNDEKEKIVEDGSEDYVKVIQELKENTVPKDQYSKLLDEKKRLIEALRDGNTLEEEDAPKTNKELRGIIFGRERRSNVELAEAMLTLRNNLVEEGGHSASPFLPTSGAISQSDLDDEQMFVDLLEHCIDLADGDNGVFTAEFQRHLKESPKRR